jgi:hypothetical protein
VVTHGYENVGMLGQARQQRIYRDYIMVEGLESIPINDSTYNVVMSSNGFAPDQIYPSAVPEIVRVGRGRGPTDVAWHTDTRITCPSPGAPARQD